MKANVVVVRKNDRMWRKFEGGILADINEMVKGISGNEKIVNGSDVNEH